MGDSWHTPAALARQARADRQLDTFRHRESLLAWYRNRGLVAGVDRGADAMLREAGVNPRTLRPLTPKRPPQKEVKTVSTTNGQLHLERREEPPPRYHPTSEAATLAAELQGRERGWWRLAGTHSVSVRASLASQGLQVTQRMVEPPPSGKKYGRYAFWVRVPEESPQVSAGRPPERPRSANPATTGAAELESAREPAPDGPGADIGRHTSVGAVR